MSDRLVAHAALMAACQAWPSVGDIRAEFAALPGAGTADDADADANDADEREHALDVLGARLMVAYSTAGASVGTSRPAVQATPLMQAGRAEWVAWFRTVGYLHHGFRLDYERPAQPLRLYRACWPGFERGLSWFSSDFYAAAWMRQDYPARRMYQVDAQPGWLLAFTWMGLALADEYVVEVPDDAEVVQAFPETDW